MNKDQLKKLEADLWSAADKLRANSDLKSSHGRDCPAQAGARARPE